MLSVLQRAELVTRMATEVERYIIELGTEGRLIEMQLEDSVVGRDGRARRARPRLHGRRLRAGDRARRSRELGSLDHTELLDFGRLAELLGYDRKTNTLDFHVAPRGYRALSGVPRLPRLVAQKVVNHFGDLEALLSASDGDLEAGRGRRGGPREGDPRGDPQASGGRHRRPIPVNQTAAQAAVSI